MIKLTGGSVAALAAGGKGVQVGDSIVQYANQCNGAADMRNMACSELAWALWRCGHRVRSHIWNDPANISGETPDRITTYGNTTRVAVGAINMSGANMGYAGDTMTGVARRVTAVRNIARDLTLIAVGTNVGTLDNLASYVTDQLENQVVSKIKAGLSRVPVIVSTIRPRKVSLAPTGNEISIAWRDRNLAINDWVRTNSGRLGYEVADPWEDLRDPQYPVGHALYGMDAPGVTRDNVHLTPIGAWRSSLALSSAISRVIAPGSWFSEDPTVSNLFTANQLLTGSSGVASGGAQGTLPTGVNMTGPGVGPVTCQCSVKTNPVMGGQTIVLTFVSDGSGPAKSTTIFNLSFTNPTVGFTSGDYVQGYMEVAIGASSAPTLMPGLQTTMGQASTVVARGLSQVVSLTAYNGQPFPDDDMGKGWILTEPTVVGSLTALNHRLNVAIRNDVAGSRTVEVSRMKIGLVTSPVTDFPWTPV